MTMPADTASNETLRMGPIKVVRVYASSAPTDVTITERLGYTTPPFSQIRHLCSSKPLGRHLPTEDRC